MALVIFSLQSAFCKDAGVVTDVQGNHFIQGYCYSTHLDSRDSKPTSTAEIYVRCSTLARLVN